MGDIIARYKRSAGFDVLYTTNFDSFGLPNELEAKKRDVPPQEYTSECISLIKQDLKRLGISYDWHRVNTTSDPAYYKWTQWLFLELYSAGLVYKKKTHVNWCNSCNTVLAHMESRGGQCDRCDSIVEQKKVSQWFIALSRYSEELYLSIDSLKGWSSRAKNLVKGFIGKTSGLLVPFYIIGDNQYIEVFIPDGQNINNVTFVGSILNFNKSEIILKKYNINRESIQHRLQTDTSTFRKRNNTHHQSRTGIDSGIKLLHPSLKIPITLLFVNYLSDQEGPLVIAGIPENNKKDKLLATELSLPLSNDVCKSHVRVNIKSKEKDYFHVRDWMVSRQKKWGSPLPIIECAWCGDVPASKHDLPIQLKPEDNNKNLNVNCPKCKRTGRYSNDTLDCYLDDVWCFLSSELSTKKHFSLENAGKDSWFPADQYHAGYDIYMYLHLYRFIASFLYKQGYLTTPEPIRIHYGHDMVLQGKTKMSKHYHNTLNVCSLIEEWGADITRIAVMLSANPNKPIRWDDAFLHRAKKQLHKVLEIASLVSERTIRNEIKTDKLPSSEKALLERSFNNIAKTITKHIEAYLPSSCIQHLEKCIRELHTIIKKIEISNLNSDDYQFLKTYILRLLILYAPFAPHATEEAWDKIGGEKLVAQASWPNDKTN